MIQYRKDLINYFVKIFNYESYLEIGVRDPSVTFDNIKIKHKEGVDLNEPATYVMPSDDFFNSLDSSKKWDIILVDAGHERDQVKRDILNSLKHLTENGTIICHDVNPYDPKKLHPDICGNAWEAFAELRMEREDLEMFTLPVNYLGVIRRGSQNLWKGEIRRTFKFLDKNRRDLMNEISVEKLYSRFGTPQ